MKTAFGRPFVKANTTRPSDLPLVVLVCNFAYDSAPLDLFSTDGLRHSRPLLLIIAHYNRSPLSPLRSVPSLSWQIKSWGNFDMQTALRHLSSLRNTWRDSTQMALSIAKPHSFTDCLAVPNLALETSHLFSDPGIL